MAKNAGAVTMHLGPKKVRYYLGGECWRKRKDEEKGGDVNQAEKE